VGEGIGEDAIGRDFGSAALGRGVTEAERSISRRGAGAGDGLSAPALTEKKNVDTRTKTTMQRRNVYTHNAATLSFIRSIHRRTGIEPKKSSHVRGAVHHVMHYKPPRQGRYWQPGYLSREIRGFASPPRAGFAHACTSYYV